eukprot:scaffold76659_cov60-Phaeocystis_antarctica.AAC.1
MSVAARMPKTYKTVRGTGRGRNMSSCALVPFFQNSCGKKCGSSRSPARYPPASPAGSNLRRAGGGSCNARRSVLTSKQRDMWHEGSLKISAVKKSLIHPLLKKVSSISQVTTRTSTQAVTPLVFLAPTWCPLIVGYQSLFS